MSPVRLAAVLAAVVALASMLSVEITVPPPTPNSPLKAPATVPTIRSFGPRGDRDRAEVALWWEPQTAVTA